MKSIFLTLAMCFAFAAPVQATEVLGFAPVESLIGSGSGDVIGTKVADDRVTTCRCMWSQLEAADVITNDKASHEKFGGASSGVLAANDLGAKPEIGWPALA